MVDGVGGGAVAYGGIVFLKGLWDTWKKHRFGVYGVYATGKTTLDTYLSIPGEIYDPENEEKSTQHRYNKKRGEYEVPKPSLKKVKYSINERVAVRTIESSDIGGQVKYWPLWLRDMVDRNVEIVIFLIDHRHLVDNTNTEQLDAFNFVVDAIVKRNYPMNTRRRRKKSRNYAPRLFALVANKADMWLVNGPNSSTWIEKWENDHLDQHPIFHAFRPGLDRLRRAGIPNIKRSISALRGYDVEETIYDCLRNKV